MESESASGSAAGWRRARPLLVLAAAAGLLAAALPLLPIPGRAGNALGNGLQLAAATLAAWLCMAEGQRHTGRARTGWLLIGLGAGAWALGQAAWTWYEVVLGSDVPTPGVNDLGYLALYPLALAGFLFLSPLAERHGAARTSLVLDGLLSALAVFVVAWPVVLQGAFERIDEPAAAVVAVAYPLADIMLLSVVGGILMRRWDVWRSGLALAYAAFACLLVADLNWTTGLFEGSYATGQAADAGWIVGFLLLAAATRPPMPTHGLRSGHYAQAVGRFLPLAAVLLGMAGFAISRLRGAIPGRGWSIAMATLVLLSLWRQVLSVKEFTILAAEREAAQGRYETLVENAAEGIVRTTPEGRIVMANEEFARIAGYGSTAALMADVAILHEVYVDPVDRQAMLHALAKEGAVRNEEIRIRRRDGAVRWVSMNLRLQATPEGERELHAFVRDITDSHLLAHDLMRTKRTLLVISQFNQALVRAGDEMVLLQGMCDTLTREGGYRMAWIGVANEDGERSVTPLAHSGMDAGYVAQVRATWAADDPRGQGPTGRAIREGRTQVAQDIPTDPRMAPWRADATERGYAASCALPLDLGPYGRAALMVYADDSAAFGADEVKLLEELARDLAFGVVSLREHASKEKAEADLRHSEALLKEAQVLAKIGSWELDLRSNVLWWSDQNYRVFGVEPGAFGASYDFFLSVVHPDDREMVDHVYTTSVANRMPYSIEHRLLMPDGSVKWVHERCETYYDVDGKPLRSVGTTQDITLQKEHQAHQALIEGKEREVKRLEELNKMRMEFLNTAAHDLKTPLTPLKLQMATLRMKGNLDKSQVNSLELMDRNVLRFQALIEDMLDAARLQAGKLKLRHAETPLAPLVQEAVASFDEATKQAKLEVEVDASTDVRIDADPMKCMQVLMNLVSNAVKYTPAGGHVRIGITATPTEAIVQVADNGLGMTPEQLGKLFQPFVRLHEEIPGTAKGTGLGLYISKGIVEQHGGRLWAESAGPGKGSTFFVAWPLAGLTPSAPATSGNSMAAA